MAIEMHSNDNAREGRPGVWIFQGKSVVLLVIGVAAFVALFRILASLDVDWPVNIVVSLLPLAGITVIIHMFVNGKPPSYAGDQLLFFLWRFRTRLYLAGALDRPPEVWRTDHQSTYLKDHEIKTNYTITNAGDGR
jgi:hypothetical protein